ncbi:MAG: glycosyltransferase family 9 protein [Candidatus Omnitrophica bacterium]|nr:glycosyltransferase family 9 protein [Candidatus Omnitrophota bacterium]MCM8777692.1 glycosyltransferase family 9 protein [Candidatus Omnitrophota bacterium]
MCPKDIAKYNIKRILLLCPGCLGDNLLLSPSIKKIRDTFPDAEIDIIIGRRAVEFADGNPWFSHYYIFQGGKRLNRLVNIIRLVNKFRSKRYDLIIDFKNSILPFFIKGRYRLTFFLKELFSEKIYTHEAERLLSFIVPFFGGTGGDISLYFPVSKKDRNDIEIFLKTIGIKPADTIVVFNPGGREKKRLSEEKFAEIGKALIKRYDSLKIIIVGANYEEKIGQKIKGFIESNNVFNLAGKTTLKQLAVLLEKASLMITNDTGTLHLASAMHCPTVAIFGPTSPYRYGPIGTKNIVVHSDIYCFPCNEKRICRNDYLCMKQISPEEVIKAAMLLLDEKEQPLLFDL